MDGADQRGPEHLLTSRHQIFEEVNGDIVVRWQEYANVASKEIINFTLGSVLGGEFL